MTTHRGLLSLSILLLLSVGAEASARSAWIAPRHQGVEIAVMCSGAACEEVGHRGSRYVVASMGERYTLSLRNRNAHWVEAVVTVDGRNIVDGHRSGVEGRGYLLAPHTSVEIDGWRTSNQKVAAFRFTSVGDSYAGRMGTGGDAGSIRLQVFPERRHRRVIPRPHRHTHNDEFDGTRKKHSTSRSDAPAVEGRGRRMMPRDRQHLGTQYGETRWQPVEERNFERANPRRPSQTVTLRYDSHAGLVARGIIRGHHYSHHDDHYVRPPPR